MNENKRKKLKRLQKAHIWPSVVFLTLSVFLAFVAFFVFTSFIIAYFAQDRMEIAYNDMVHISRMLSNSQTEEDEEKILQYLEKHSNYAEAIYILDEENEVISGFGDKTYDMDKSGKLLTDKKYTVYADSESKYNIISTVGELEIDEILNEELKSNLSVGTLGVNQKEIIYEDFFWIGTPLPDHQTMMAKCRLYFYRGDFQLAVVIGVLSIIVMLLPILFLFINVLSNVVHQGKITKLLYMDAVTSGNSWMYFEQNVNKLLSSRMHFNHLYAVVDISMMKYRNYCTCHGAKAGEELLEKIDKHLMSFMRKSEYCAHYSKSNFVLLLKCLDNEICEERVRGMIRELPKLLGHGSTVFHAGIYFIEPVKGTESKKFLYRRQADVAEYYNRASAARESLMDDGQTGVAVFDQKLLEKQVWEHKVEEKMQKALENEEFQVYIQPKYNPVTEKLAGAEALVRWVNDEDGFISPGRFIPIFENNGFITKIDDYMISHAAKLQAEWIKEGKSVVPISVNVSRAHFADPDLAGHICRLVDEYQVPRHLIEIELTESAFFDDRDALLNTVKELKQLGFDISMDDFGAGYSSLNSLKDLPLDVLKLDAEFFRGEDEGERGEIVVSQAIQLAKELHMRIVAEGIEKKEQVDFLAAKDCDMIQGFYFAKPMPADEYAKRLEGE